MQSSSLSCLSFQREFVCLQNTKICFVYRIQKYVVVFCHSLMFWTDWENKNPRIERATMSGHDRRVIVDITELHGGWPNGLTIDYPEHRLYWIDAR